VSAELSLVSISIEPGKLPTFSLSSGAFTVKEQALTCACLIGKVTNTKENQTAVEAQKELKRVSQMFEKERKKLKEPIIEAGRKLDRLIQTEVDEVERELGRIAALTSEFQQAEARRIREEEEAQRRELARIEAEKQMEIQRILKESPPERAAADIQQASERAAAASIIEAKPIESSRVSGQVVKTEWDIQIINPYDLAKFHPDCVKIEPMLTPIKAALNEGRELRGVKAVKRISADVRVRTQHVIEV